ncbi:hypothetical protein A7K94_0214180, partial [Modestobacter sp. VKM Ac-2676]
MTVPDIPTDAGPHPMRAGVVLTTAAIAAAWLARRQRARRLARRTEGSPPAVRTDDGIRLHVEVTGAASAPTVVLVHGIGADLSMFDPQWTALRSRARVVRYDQRGHGSSGWGGRPRGDRRPARGAISARSSTSWQAPGRSWSS